MKYDFYKECWPTSKAFWTLVIFLLAAVIVGCATFVNMGQETPTALKVVAPMATATEPVAALGFPNLTHTLRLGNPEVITNDGIVLAFTKVDSTIGMVTVEINGTEQTMFENNAVIAGSSSKIILRTDASGEFYLEIWQK